jgi:hypothetical protein
MSQDRNWRRAFVNPVTNLEGPQKAGNFLTAEPLLVFREGLLDGVNQSLGRAGTE